MNIFGFLRPRKKVPVGFVDYDVAAIARIFDIDVPIAGMVIQEYHNLLNGVEHVGTNVGRADLAALTMAVASQFGAAPATSVSIARWFSRLQGVREEQQRAQKLGIAEKTWSSVCQYGSPSGNQQHASYEGRKFSSDRGLFVDGTYLLPGAEIGCMCCARSILPGFDD